MEREIEIEESNIANDARIKVVGVGGGGCNMLDRMIEQNCTGSIDMVAMNTDTQALKASLATNKIQIGEKKTQGLGAGMNPKLGREAALENYDEIKSSLENSDIIFIAAGFGGGTGTGAAPIVAKAAKDVGALTICVVTKPFDFEGTSRMSVAQSGLDELSKVCNSVLTIPNQKVLSTSKEDLGARASFKVIDNILASSVRGISNIILSHGSINIDFADVKTIMQHRGRVLMGVGQHSGDNAACEAMRTAIASPLLDDMNIDGAMGILVHFTIDPDYSLGKIAEAMNIVKELVHNDCKIIFGTSEISISDKNLVRITMIATGFGTDGKLTFVEPGITKRKKMHLSRDLSILDEPTFLRKQMD